MFILARGGATYARLRFNAGPGGEVVIPVEVAYDRVFGGSDLATWLAEYEANIQVSADTRWAWDDDLSGQTLAAARWPYEYDNEAFEHELAVAGYVDDGDELWTEED